MNATQSLGPFSISPRSNLRSRFIGREKELEEIRVAFMGGARSVIIVGPPGSGKTSLAQVFARRSQAEYPGGVFFAFAPGVETPTQLFTRILPAKLDEAALLVIDGVEVFDRDGLDRIQELLSENIALRIVLTSRRDIILSGSLRTIHLAGLTKREIRELLRTRNTVSRGEYNEEFVRQLFQYSQGNAQIADLVASLVRDGTVSSWQDLLDILRGFRTPGIVGPDGGPLRRGSKEYDQVIVDVSSANAEILGIIKNDPELLWKLPPRKFEEIVAEILDKQGYSIQLTPASGDGGFDIFAARNDQLGKFLYLVECKRYIPPNKVGVEIVRSLYGVVQIKRATAGAIVSTSFFTQGAEEFQRDVHHQLHLHDYVVLQRWISDFPLSWDKAGSPLI